MGSIINHYYNFLIVSEIMCWPKYELKNHSMVSARVLLQMAHGLLTSPISIAVWCLRGAAVRVLMYLIIDGTPSYERWMNLQYILKFLKYIICIEFDYSVENKIIFFLNSLFLCDFIKEIERNFNMTVPLSFTYIHKMWNKGNFLKNIYQVLRSHFYLFFPS